jgi:hypothetical protein
MSAKAKTSIAVLWFLVLLAMVWMFVPSVSTKGIAVFRAFNPHAVYLQVDPKLDQTRWPLPAAAAFVDQYTGTKMVFANCRRGSRCVTIRENADLPVQIAGRASWTRNALDLRIEFNPGYATRPAASRLQISVHELGHAFGIHSHNPLCTSAMYAYITCQNGTSPPKAFTADEIEILERY